MKLKRIDSISMDQTYYTDEGYLVDHPIVTTCGIFEYKNDDGTLSAFSLMVPTFLCTLCPRLKLMERSTQTGHIRLLIRFLRISMACRNLLTRLQCLSKSLIH